VSETVLICYDGSEGARRAIAAAGAFLSRQRAVVLNIGPPLTIIESVALLVPGIMEFDDITAVSKKVAEQGAAYARAAGFHAEADGVLGAPIWNSILSYADRVDAALIVLGTRALGRAGELVRSSISHQVVERAQRPVFVVPSWHDHNGETRNA
jgi:nucleotide-binding universal stress UspA family protein